ncbi:hypothetical protein K491DRAFT_521502 [Lophiostoma macrostomum CBS 122681]|uniref:Peptidase M10 metallopeptidase domain-containing protein n=1 Tax=Lophiostoma macrostomum CBS 122681 TaxID=1314788 RepID=A0A6A6T0W0_9PLEO|nr:hypothetical protein K491DRAFT_521502 [Lophiostoma macrostomum CBS 122681]
MGSTDDAYAVTRMNSNGVTMLPGLINITFNDDWNWADDMTFSFTAMHEMGHALGLSHSTVENAVMWPYYRVGDYRPMHPDDQAAIHSLYGWKSPRWKRVDSSSGAKALVSVTSNSTTAALDGLYQIRSTGQVVFYNNSAGTWTSVDNNKDTVQIAGAGGNLYQRHADGSVYKYSGSSTNWQYIGAASDNVIDIIASGDQIYSRRKDGWIARWSGSGLTWATIENPKSSTQIAVTDSKTLWNLLTTGDLVRSTWPYGTGWTVVDQNPANVAIATGGDEFYKLQSDGTVVWLDSEANYWRSIEEDGAVSIYAVGSYLYSRHQDGSIWRYTGTPLVWEELDSSVVSVAVVGDRKGAVWELLNNGDVMQLVS